MSDAATPQGPEAKRFNEILVVMDDQTWIWGLVTQQLSALSLEHVRLPSTVPIRRSWNRLKNASRIVVHWEAKQRSGGAVIEEILSVQPNFDTGERIIVLTTNPTHEDVVYFSELGVHRIVTLRNRDKDLVQAGRELALHLTVEQAPDRTEQMWRRLLYLLDTLPETVPDESIAKLDEMLKALKPEQYTARYLDAIAKLYACKNNDTGALKSWHLALDKNPNYYRTYHNLIAFHRRRGRPHEALGLMQKMHELNKANVGRLVSMGEIQMTLGDVTKAEFYFNSALARDAYCSGALNGMAEIRFHQGHLDESRQLLEKSQLAFKTAANLNFAGIEMVRRSRYEDALEHYTRAQYVLPQQDKGPLLFYNIGLCYFRWGKADMAREFLKVALIKDPAYKKARKLMAQLAGPLGDASSDGAA